MKDKVYFSWFILCGILSQGIFGQFLKEDVDVTERLIYRKPTGESSKLLIRQKRVIDRRHGEDRPLKNGDFPYIVNLRYMTRLHCVATILSLHTVITAARCVAYADLEKYTVYSGSSYSFRGNVHNITDRKMHGQNPSRGSTFPTGIALITVNPPFVFNQTTSSVALHSGPILAGMEGFAIGWGFRSGAGPVESQYTQRLRLISLPIMNHRECVNIYRDHFPITDEDICTYHPQKLCADNDTGAPFIIDNQLVGVHIGSVLRLGAACPTTPDVFVLLQHLNYGPWIMRNIVH